ncbi:sugar phosphate isomerase/epimerase family protein [Thauera sp. SDU_THAU2]|uniref:sugar phosphate isomerase/epimerase family protein n=1 Tax=Thauera sp. SDU_THAU2 TaxID=3136633 RepID=UPI00311D490C
MKRPLSLAALTVLDLSPADMVSCAAWAGYSHVGLRLNPATPTEAHYPTIGDTPVVEDILARLQDTGVRVLDVEILRLKPDTVVADFEPFMATGARFEARHVLLAGNDPEFDRLVDNYGRTCELAARYGMAAHIEPMPWTDVRDIAAAERVMAAAGRGNAGIIVDPIHFDRAGDTVDGLAAIPASRFQYMQFCDAPAERPGTTEEILFQARAERKAPGEGGLPLGELLRALPDGIPLSLEVPQMALARTVGPFERARRLREATERLLAGL